MIKVITVGRGGGAVGNELTARKRVAAIMAVTTKSCQLIPAEGR